MHSRREPGCGGGVVKGERGLWSTGVDLTGTSTLGTSYYILIFLVAPPETDTVLDQKQNDDYNVQGLERFV